MDSNLTFYGITAAIGFILSLALRKEERLPLWRLWLIPAAPLCWALTGAIVTFAVTERSVNEPYHILRYFDADNFIPTGQQPITGKAFGLIAFIVVCYFTLSFDALLKLALKANRATFARRS
jgi:hypothetical protein